MYFCKSCGSEYAYREAIICVKCGVRKGVGNSYCSNCGCSVAQGAAVCLNCGAALATGRINAPDKISASSPRDAVRLLGADTMFLVSIICFTISYIFIITGIMTFQSYADGVISFFNNILSNAELIGSFIDIDLPSSTESQRVFSGVRFTVILACAVPIAAYVLGAVGFWQFRKSAANGQILSGKSKGLYMITLPVILAFLTNLGITLVCLGWFFIILESLDTYWIILLFIAAIFAIGSLWCVQVIAIVHKINRAIITGKPSGKLSGSAIIGFFIIAGVFALTLPFTLFTSLPVVLSYGAMGLALRKYNLAVEVL